MTLLTSAPKATLGARLSPARGRTSIWAVTIGTLGFLVSFIGNWVPSVWYDEAATVTSATRTYTDLWRELQGVDAVHGTYYAFMHVVFDLIGYSPLTLRLPSAIAVGVAAGLVVVLVRLLGRPRMAVISGLLFVFMPRVMWMGGEGRSYAFTALVAVSLTIVLLLAVRSSGRLLWVAYGALALVGGFLFAYLLLVVVAHGVTLAWLRWQRHPGMRRAMVGWAAAAGAAALVLVPFLFELQAQGKQVSWITPTRLDTLYGVFVQQWFTQSIPIAVIGWLLLGLGTWRLMRGRRASLIAAFVLPAMILPTVLLIAVNLVHTPLYSARYVTMCTPFVAIAMGAAVDGMRRRWMAVSTVALVVVIAIPTLVLSLRQPESKSGSASSTVAELIANERARDPDADTGFIFGPLKQPHGSTRVVEYAYPSAFADSVDVTLAQTGPERGNLWESTRPLVASLDRLNGLDRVFLLSTPSADVRTSTTATLTRAGWREAGTWRLNLTDIVEYERIPGATLTTHSNASADE